MPNDTGNNLATASAYAQRVCDWLDEIKDNSGFFSHFSYTRHGKNQDGHFLISLNEVYRKGPPENPYMQAYITVSHNQIAAYNFSSQSPMRAKLIGFGSVDEFMRQLGDLLAEQKIIPKRGEPAARAGQPGLALVG